MNRIKCALITMTCLLSGCASQPTITTVKQEQLTLEVPSYLLEPVKPMLKIEQDDPLLIDKREEVWQNGTTVIKTEPVLRQQPPPKGRGLKESLLTSLSDPSSEGELRWIGMYRHRGMYILVPRSAACD